MPSQIEKLQAHASHLLDGFLGLREKYAILEPMLFDPEVVKARGSNAQARGFKLLRHTLFLNCAQDIAKLSLDADSSPSIKNIVHALEDSSLRDQLREQYAIWHIPVPEDEDEPAVLAALERMERREEVQRREQFDDQYKRLTVLWTSLIGSSVLEAFRTIRNKVSAHTDVHFVNGEYKLVDIGSLGIKWKDLKETIAELQEVVELLGLLIRNAGFAWDSLDHQLAEASTGFWSGLYVAR